MSSNVNIQMTANDREVLKVLQAQTRALDKLENRMDKVSRTSRRAATTTKKGMNDATGATMKFVGAVAGIGGVIGAVQMAAAALRAEYDGLVKRQETARLTQLDAASAVRRTRINFADDATMKTGELEGVIQGIAKRQGSTFQVIAAALSDGFSAKGQLSNKVVVDTVEQAAKVLPLDLDDTKEMSSRALDILKLKPELSPEAVLGFLRETQQSARVTSLAQLGKSAVPAIVALSKTGDSVEQGGELFSTFTQSTSDAEGLKSGRGVKNFANKLMEFQVGKIDTKGKDDAGTFNIPQGQIDAFKKATHTQERVELMRNSPELRRQFLGQATFDSFVRATSVGLLKGDADTDAIFQAAKRSVNAPGKESAAKFRKEFIPGLNAGKFEGVAKFDRGLKAIEEESRLNNTSSQAGKGRAALTTFMSGSDGRGGHDLPGIDSMLNAGRLALFDADVASGMSPDKAAIEALKNIEGEFREPSIFNPFGGPKKVSDLSQADQKAVEDLRKIIKLLEDSLATQKESTRNSKPQRPQPQGRAPAAGLGRDRR